MINGDLSIFLDTGWYQESTLYYKNHIYWLEASYDSNSKLTTFIVDKWEAINENNIYYHSILNNDGTLDYERILEITDADLEIIKCQFLKANIFDGYSFWNVESELIWLEEALPIKKGDI